MAIAGGLISIGQHFSHSIFMCIWVILSWSFEFAYMYIYTYIYIYLKLRCGYKDKSCGFAFRIWLKNRIGTVGLRGCWLRYISYHHNLQTSKKLFKSVNFCALDLILRHAKGPLCVRKSTIILWEASIKQSVRMSTFLLYPQMWKVTPAQLFLFNFIWGPQEESISPYPMNLVQSWDLVNAIPVATSSSLWSLSLVRGDIKSNH